MDRLVASAMLIEDQFLIAMDVEKALRRAGATDVRLASSVRDALHALTSFVPRPPFSRRARRACCSATAIASAIGRPGPASSSCASPGCVKASTPKQKRLALAGPLSAAGNARAARRWLANPHLANPNLALSDAHLPRIGDPMAAGRFRELGERAGL